MSVYKLDIKDKEIMQKAEKITGTQYIENDCVEIDNFISAIEDLLIEIDRQDEKYDDLLEDLEANYRPITKQEQYE